MKDLISDPRFVAIKKSGPMIMEFRSTDRQGIRRLNFLERVWDALSPRSRAQRSQKLMRHPTPIRGLFWRAWMGILGIVKGKAWRERPWKVTMDFSESEAYFTTFEDRQEKSAHIAKILDDIMLTVETPLSKQQAIHLQDIALEELKNFTALQPDSLIIDTIIKEEEEAFERQRRIMLAIINRKPIEFKWEEINHETFLEENAEELMEANGTERRRHQLGKHSGIPIIICGTCGHISDNPQHISERYCPRCRMYHDAGEYAGRQREIIELIKARNFKPIKGHPKPVDIPITMYRLRGAIIEFFQEPY